MINKKSHNLVKIIYYDLCIHNKMQLFLLFLIIVSAISIICITYQTRCMIINREEFLLKKHFLEYEWNDLVIKQAMLSNPARIEKIAVNKLHMCYLDPLLIDNSNN